MPMRRIILTRRVKTMIDRPTETTPVADLLAAYRLGTISFLELIERMERLLQITPSDQREPVNPDAAALKGKDE